MSSELSASPGKSKSAGLFERIEEGFDSKRKELGVEDELKDIDNVTTLMLVAFGEHGIRSIEDLANCAVDDLLGWNEVRDGKTLSFPGILEAFGVSREECAAMIMRARERAGWLETR